MASSDSVSKQKVTLVSSDNEHFDIDRAVAMESLTIKHQLEEDNLCSVIPLPTVTSNILRMVIDYCVKHVEPQTEANADVKTKEYDRGFVKKDVTILLDIVLAAEYLKIKELEDLCAQAVADLIKGKSVEEVRTTLCIDNDYAPKEEKKVREENSWAFQ